MVQPIAFYFDFSSPYAYLTAQVVDDLAARHGREAAWKPFLLGALFKVTGQQPLLDMPIKGDYARHDLARSARALGVPFVVPESFPFHSVAAARAFYWLEDRDAAVARSLGKALFDAAFGQGRDISRAETVIEIAADHGVERDALAAALQDQAVKDRLRREVDQAIESGVFGSPILIVDGEAFWGHDHLPDVERWLDSGGW